jgi:pyruvate/2-oxoglutarate dehydrogenase complex dihydrolipoamide acyltransferase (E2) component
MIGFAAAIVGEFAGKGGALAQLGLSTPSTPLLATILAATGVAVTVGSVSTAARVRSGDMSARELARYRSFLGLDKEGDISLAANAMKGITASPPPAAAAAAASASAATAIVAEGEQVAEASAAAAAAPAPAAPRSAAQMQQQNSYYSGTTSDFDYAAGVERTNGRWAALGFLAAILVEAATGKGILMQLIMYGKISGLLGPMSGF